MVVNSISASDTRAMLQEDEPGRYAPTRLQRFVIEFSRRCGLGNGAVRKHGAELLCALRPGPIDYDYHGLTLRFDPEIPGSVRHLLMTPDWSDWREQAFIEAHLPKNGTFLDIGMNAGFFTFLVAGKRPDCRVIAFEPNHKIIVRASFNVEANDLKQVHIEEVALWDCDETVTLDGATVRRATLDRVLEKHAVETIDVMKIDVDGPEDRILMPFFRSKPKSQWPKAMIIEHIIIGRRRDNSITFAKENGYRQLWRTKLNTALVLSE
jgi:hypothetical protein